MSSRRSVVLVCALGLAVIGAYAWHANRAPQTAKPVAVGLVAPALLAQSGPVAVEVAQVRTVSLADDVSAVGTLVSNESVVLRPVVSGRIDKVYMLDNAILDDEIWNMIRLNPTKLPIGNHKIIPSMLSSRFGHFPLQAEDATLTLMQNISENDTTYIYTVSYKNIERVLKIFFTATFPFELQGWEEIIKDSNGKPNKTTATPTHSMQLDYWTKNKNEFRTLRKQLGLPEDF